MIKKKVFNIFCMAIIAIGWFSCKPVFSMKDAISEDFKSPKNIVYNKDLHEYVTTWIQNIDVVDLGFKDSIKICVKKLPETYKKRLENVKNMIICCPCDVVNDNRNMQQLGCLALEESSMKWIEILKNLNDLAR